ncbi:MAG: cytochrome c [Pararhodobacter sp.]|nr:cytochrome c [Pararhodobacter sp.]
MFRKFSVLALAAALALPALAPAAANEAAVKARQSQFTLFAFNLGVLAGMAQGQREYDAATAQTAADNLYHLTRQRQDFMWPEGSDNASIEGTRALPAIWDDLEGFANRYGALQDGIEALQGAAGTDLASLQGALGGAAGACQACHQQFRASE